MLAYSKFQTTLGEFDAVRNAEVNVVTRIQNPPTRLINPNSVVSYNEITENRKVQCEMVLEAIRQLDKPNIRDITYFLDIESSSVCGRLGALKKEKKIIVGGQKHDVRTNKETDWYEVIENGI